MATGLVEATARVTLYVRVGCHLCDVARDVVAGVCDELGERFLEIDVDADPRRCARSSARRSVMTLVDGRQHDFWRVDADHLRRALGS
ncbi:MAG: glutaredoxin family protein [Nocardioides sp.]